MASLREGDSTGNHTLPSDASSYVLCAILSSKVTQHMQIPECALIHVTIQTISPPSCIPCIHMVSHFFSDLFCGSCTHTDFTALEKV